MKRVKACAAVILLFLLVVSDIGSKSIVYAEEGENTSGYQFRTEYDEGHAKAVIKGDSSNVPETTEITQVSYGDVILDPDDPQMTVEENGSYVFTVSYRENEMTGTEEGSAGEDLSENTETEEKQETITVEVTDIQSVDTETDNQTEPADEASTDNGISLYGNEEVYLTVESDGRVVSGGSLGEQSGLKDGVKLFTFDQPGEKTLEVTLDVSEEAGNELMDAQTEVDWTFTVQDYSDDNVILIKSMDMTAYTGGDSMSEDSFPTARYSVYTPDGVDLSDLTFSIEGGSTFSVEQEENGIIQNLEENFVYNLSDGASDPSQNDGKPGAYTIGIEEDGMISAEADGTVYTVAYDPGILTVRYVTDPDGILGGDVDIARSVICENEGADSIADKAQNSTMPFGVVSEDTIFRTNGKTEIVGLTEDDMEGKISLLCDTILSLGADDRDRTRELTERAEEFLSGQGFSLEERQYEYRYLDLVNEYDGNIWVSSSEGVDVYYPYPEGTSYENADDTAFTVLHFMDLHREYGFYSDEQIEDLIASCEVEIMKVEPTEYGLKFHVPESGFSPFAVTWQPMDIAEQSPGYPAGTDAVKTGDDTDGRIWMAALAGSAAIAVVILAFKRKRKEK